MLVKNEPDDFFLVDQIADVETEIFRKELFGSSVENYLESSLDGDFMQPSDDSKVFIESDSGSLSSPTSSTSSSCATLDDNLLQGGLTFTDNYREIADIFSTSHSMSPNDIQSCDTPAQPHSPLMAVDEIKSEGISTVVWHQLMQDVHPTTPPPRNGVTSFPNFKVIKGEVESKQSSPILNVISPSYEASRIIAADSSSSFRTISVVTTAVPKSSPPSSPPYYVNTPLYSPSSPSTYLPNTSPKTLPATVVPSYKVLSVSNSSSGKTDILARTASNGQVTKTKKIQPKMSIAADPIMMGALVKTTKAPAPKPQQTASFMSSGSSRVGGSNNCSSMLPSSSNSGSLSTSGSVSLSQQVKLQKRHERMIKNRESASLSRKKKKEYVNNLESEIKELKSENNELKQEINRLNTILKDMERQCNLLRMKLSGKDMGVSNGGSKTNGAFTTTKVAAPMLLTLFCLIAINVPGTLLPSWPGARPQSSNDLLPGTNPQLSDPLSVVDHSSLSRHLLWSDYEDDASAGNESTYLYFNSTICPTLLNETESLRLETELRDWFDSKESSSSLWRLKTPPQKPNHISTSFDDLASRLSRKKSALKKGGLPARPSRTQRRESVKALSTAQQHNVPRRMYHEYLYKNSLTIEPSMHEDTHTALVDGPPPPPSLQDLLREASDTFYVVSFSSDFLLVPAEAHNSSFRPKMTFMLPATPVNSTSTGGGSTPSPVSMLRIDCDVLHIRHVDISAPSYSKQDPAAPVKKDYHHSNTTTKFSPRNAWLQSQYNKFGGGSVGAPRNKDSKATTPPGKFAATKADSKHVFHFKPGNKSMKETEDDEDFSDVNFQSIYKEGHLDNVVKHPYRLHPKYIERYSSGLASNNTKSSNSSSETEH